MRAHRFPSILAALLLLSAVTAAGARAQSSVTLPGSFQDELGCPGDWQPDCAATHLTQGSSDGVWRGAFVVPAGSWEYKAAIDDSWVENYGAGAQRDGPNIPLELLAETEVTFYYDHDSHWITDNVNSLIVTLVGSFQSELGCAGDWDPACLRSWMQDPDGDGVYWFTTAALPAGNYEAKVAIDEGWVENYGAGGVRDGANIPFTVPGDCVVMAFGFDATTKIVTIVAGAAASQPASVTVAGSLQSELGCAGDWDPACALAHLGLEADDQVWQGAFDLPAGSWEYKAALDDGWDENYGANAQRNGANIGLDLAAARNVKFYYDHASHWITDNVNSVIAVVAGSFQSELGCAGDWDASCLRSWLQDPDGDGLYVFRTAALPAGSYECKVAIGEGWAENYGAGGVPDGPNIPFTVPEACTEIAFTYDAATHVLEVTGGAPVNRPPDCSGAVASTGELWPPDHRLVPVEILGVTDPDGDPVAITVISVRQDEPVLGVGDGRTCPDAVLVDGALSLRAERSGKGNGRVYLVSFTADDGRGGTCGARLRVCVPHDQGEPDAVARGGAELYVDGCAADEDPFEHDSMGRCPARGRGADADVVPSDAPSLEAGAVVGNLATVAYALPRDGDVLLAVYDLGGRRVAVVERGPRAAGAHRASWDAGSLSPGVYFYRLRVDGASVTRPVLIRR